MLVNLANRHVLHQESPLVNLAINRLIGLS